MKTLKIRVKGESLPPTETMIKRILELKKFDDAIIVQNNPAEYIKDDEYLFVYKDHDYDAVRELKRMNDNLLYIKGKIYEYDEMIKYFKKRSLFKKIFGIY